MFTYYPPIYRITSIYLLTYLPSTYLSTYPSILSLTYSVTYSSIYLNYFLIPSSTHTLSNYLLFICQVTHCMLMEHLILNL